MCVCVLELCCDVCVCWSCVVMYVLCVYVCVLELCCDVCVCWSCVVMYVCAGAVL